MRLALLVLGLALSTLGASSTHAQPQRDALFLEWGGHGGFFTLSYERAFGRVSPRLGIGMSFAGVHAPAMMTYRFGDGRGRLEAGGGAVVILGASDGPYGSPIWPAATIGYRLDLPDAPLALRAEFTPMWIPGDGITPWVGLGIGVSFDRRHVLR